MKPIGFDAPWLAIESDRPFEQMIVETWVEATRAIESSFATVRLRTKVTKGAGSKKAALAMAYKLLDAAQQRWRRFNGHELIADVLNGAAFKDGEPSPTQTITTTASTRRSPPERSHATSSTTI